MSNLITKPTELSLKILEEYVSEGDSVVDATAGNGHDTLALAKLVGLNGTVYAFDIQESALCATKKLLEEEGVSDRCKLILGSHHQMAEYIPDQKQGKISAVVFNLGYLPKGDKEKTTRTGTTLPAIEQALELIRPGGLVAVTMYGGHAEGAEEKEELLLFSKNLPSKEYHVAYVALLNQKKQPPELLLITKK
ncbi:MAG: class I SAM-dependent methyltransferase [Bacillota bacterium]